MSERATLYLLPVGLGAPEAQENTANWLPTHTQQLICSLDYFVVENAKTARAWLKHFSYPRPLQTTHIETIPQKPQAQALQNLLAPALAGHNIGLMSEAGCPAIADPGAELVRMAHQLGIRVAPQVGPSSLLLALMGSGLNGQSFAFHGYLPVKEPDCAHTIGQLAKESARLQRTQLFIETPYRNLKIFDALLKNLPTQSLLAVACDLATPTEWISCASVAQWKTKLVPEIAKRPTVFLFLVR